MTKFTKISILITLVLLIFNLNAKDQGYYISIDVGPSLIDSKAFSKGTNQLNSPQEGYEIDSDFVTEIGIGYKFNNQFRLELELQHRNFETDSQPLNANPQGTAAGNIYIVEAETKSLSLMMNTYYDYSVIGKTTLYIKGGLGLTQHKTKAKIDIQPLFQIFGVDEWYHPKDKKTEFTWSIGTGIEYQISKKLSGKIEYQYVDSQDSKTGKDLYIDWTEMNDLESHEITLGLSYQL